MSLCDGRVGERVRSLDGAHGAVGVGVRRSYACVCVGVMLSKGKGGVAKSKV